MINKLAGSTEFASPAIPCEECNHALITGISISNRLQPKVGSFNHLFSIGYEDVYIWKHEKNAPSALVSVVNLSVKEKPFWKTAGRLIQLASSFSDSFELIENPFEYKWIYDFDPHNTTADKIVFYHPQGVFTAFIPIGRIYPIEEIASLSSIIELLETSDCTYNAVSLLYSAFSIHRCCIICELGSNPWHDHIAIEPELWDQAYILQNLEMAIVQSCRAVECILGEPPKSQNKSGVMRFKEKWRSKLCFDPDSLFEKAAISFFEFYHKLFSELRNPSAHSYGNTHYDLQRKMAVEAQCFSFNILKNYVINHLLPNDTAMKKLKFIKDI